MAIRKKSSSKKAGAGKTATRKKVAPKKAVKREATKKTAAKAKTAKKKVVSKKAKARTRAGHKPTLPVLSGDAPICVVGIGVSGGGLEAMMEFLSRMPEETGICFVLIPHLDPSHSSIMSELLQKHTGLEVREAEDGAKVKADRMYVIPPGKDIALMSGSLHLMDPQKKDGVRHPIDYFFRTLAKDQGERSACIVMSGAGTDGTQGLKDIKGAGGMIMVQDPTTARYDGMPRSAIETGLADFVLPPERMPGQLIKYVRHPYIERVDKRDSIMRNISDKLDKVVLQIRDTTGHDFSYYKSSTIIRRVERRMNLHQITDVSVYIKHLRQNPSEVKSLSKELFIGVTSFFRDPEAFDVLKQTVLPQLLKDRPQGQHLRVWVPGCSTGEEAFSLAMVLTECMGKARKKFGIQIFATDIDSTSIDKARTGIYPESIAADVSSERLEKFFVKKDKTYQVKKHLRETVVFAEQNMIKDPPFTRLDIVSCRNLLIYLNSEMQKKLLPLFHFVLNPGGVLFLGSSESVGDATDMFSVADRKWKIFKRKNTQNVRYGRLEFPVLHTARVGITEAQRTGVALRPREPSELGEAARRLLVDEFVHITKLEELIEQLKGLHTAFAAEPPDKSKTSKVARKSKGKIQGHASELKKELAATKRYLQHIIEDKEATNEELQASNEELQSANEELQTSKEEIQSVNEELVTVNSELQNKMEEFSNANNDLNNLLSSTNIAVIFLNNELCIKRFTPAAKKVANFIDADVGRPIAQLTTKIEEADLMEDIRRVQRTLVPSEKEVKANTGQWFLMRVFPYRTSENVIEGVVMTFFDITESKHSREFAKSIVDTVREPLLVLDSNLKVLSANIAFYKTFRTNASGTLNKRVYELGNGQWRIPSLKRLLEKILPESAQLSDFLVEHKFPKIGQKRMLLNARRIYEDAKKTERILLAIEDVTEKERAGKHSVALKRARKKNAGENK